jgi:hypothetical protein
VRAGLRRVLRSRRGNHLLLRHWFASQVVGFTWDGFVMGPIHLRSPHLGHMNFWRLVLDRVTLDDPRMQQGHASRTTTMGPPYKSLSLEKNMLRWRIRTCSRSGLARLSPRDVETSCQCVPRMAFFYQSRGRSANSTYVIHCSKTKLSTNPI